MKLLKVWLAVCLIGAILSYALASNWPQNFRSSGLLFVTRKTDTSAVNYFTYDGYYAQQTAQQFTDSVLGLLKSLPFKETALVRIGYPSDASAVKDFNDRVVIQKIGPQLLSVSVSSTSAETSSRLWQALIMTAVSTVGGLNSEGDNRIVVEPLTNKPLTEVVIFRPWLASLGTFFGLWALGTAGWGIKRYLKGVK